MEAIVIRVYTRPHPNADRIQLGTASGYQVIVSLDIEDGELGILFPSDTQLSHEYCMANKLYAKHPETGESMGGYLGKQRRITAQKFRGEKSEALWMPISSLGYTGAKLEKLKEGDLLNELNGQEICCKYVSARQKSDMSYSQKVKQRIAEHFKPVGETGKLRQNLGKLRPGDVITVTEKLHGTSGRTGRALVRNQMTKWKVFWNKWMKRLPKYKTEDWKYISGSRRVVFNPDAEIEDKFYATGFRQEIHNHIKELGLHKGETLYYEIVGYDENNTPIMPHHTVEDKKMIKRYGKQMVYSYGCGNREYKVYVYKITMTNEDGKSVTLSYPQMKERCGELGLNVVPYIKTIVYEDQESLLKEIDELSAGSSLLCDYHIREGVVLMVNDELPLKYKSFWFCELEGIKKNNDEYVDPEDLA